MDGFCSGAIVKYKYSECELIGINYGQPFPWDKIIPLETVVIVDFTLQPFEDMIRLNKTNKLIWCDHHKTALEESEKFNFSASGGQNCRIGTAGCELTWEYLFPNDPLPVSVYLLGRYDVWDHVDPRVLPFQYGIRRYDTRPENQELWKSLFEGEIEIIDDITYEGNILLSYETEQNMRYAKSCAFEIDFEGYKAIVMNKGFTNSLAFDSVYNPEKHDIKIAFVRRKDYWTVSLYSNKIDVTEICKKFGGGGHREAGGFQSSTCPF
jgi:oligoribonuclease NrnB/cAMP/cGMP phosphodiesterase (DHH superfamily)